MTMVSAFLIAAVLVSPFAYVTFRRILADRRAALGPWPDDGDADLDAADLDATDLDATDEPALGRDVGRVVAELRDLAQAHPPGESFELTVPSDATIGGRPADPALVLRLVVDDLRRSGVDVEDPRADAVLRCRVR